MSASEIVATFVAGSEVELAESFLLKAVLVMEMVCVGPARIDWLAKNCAADIIGIANNVEDIRNAVVPLLEGHAIDVIVQPRAKRRKRFLVADMESTIIQQEMLDELADVIGLRDRVAEITRRAMNGELDFAAALKERVALLKGQPVSILEKVSARVTLMPGAKDLVSTMMAHDSPCWLVSGGFGCFVEPVARQLGFAEGFANNLMVANDQLTGEVFEPILDKNTKKQLLEHGCKQFGLGLADSITVGDGANDIPMLSASNDNGGLGVAYHAKPNVRAVVPNQINHTDLQTLLFAQGYKRQEFKPHN